MTTQFVKGEVAHLTLEVTNLLGAFVDPAALTLTVLKPDATTTTLATARDSVGKYSADLPLDLSGAYSYRWQSSGTNQGVGEGSFFVRAQQFGA
jgi:hypothetical protein